MTVKAVTTSFFYNKQICKSNKKRPLPLTEESLREGCHLGLDSHADVHCVGRHARITEVFEGRMCNVQPFHDSYQPMQNVLSVNSSFAFDTEDGQTFVLDVNQALDFSDSMENSLLCTNQVRCHGVVVDDCPIFLDQLNRSTHSVYFPNQDVRLPLSMKGPISYLPVRYPSEEEMEFCQHLELSDPSSPWDPSSLNGYNTESKSVQVSATCTNTIEDELMLPYLLDDLSENIIVGAIQHSPRDKSLLPETLSKLWDISLHAARDTIRSTTQDHFRVQKGQLYRRYKTRAHQRQYRQLGGYLAQFYSDTFKMPIISTRGNEYIQLFTNKSNYIKSYPMRSKSHSHHALDRFFHEVGLPSELMNDGAKELVHGEWGKKCRRHDVPVKTTEPHSPWQNQAELSGGIIKRKLRRMMQRSNTPIRLWDYCWEYVSNVTSLTASGHFLLEGVTPYEKVHGYSPNISELCMFKWYDWIWFHEPTDPMKMQLGRWLGPAYDIGQGMAHYVLASTGKVRTRSTVSALSDDDLISEAVKERQSAFTSSIESTIGNYCTSTLNNVQDYDETDPYKSIFDDLDEELDSEDIEPYEVDEDGSPVTVPDAEEYLSDDPPSKETQDEHIGMRVQLPHQGEYKEGTIISREKHPDGSLIGTSNTNPILDTRQYVVDFGEGDYGSYSTNVLIENLYSQVDDEGLSHSILKSISNHRKLPEAVPKEEGLITLPSGARKRRITTKGWELYVDWIDGTSSWIPLSVIKESNPIETAEYAISRDIQSEPAYAWWVPHVIKKRNRIIKQIQHRVAKKGLKFGVEIPNTVQEAYELDRKNGNDLWDRAIKKELKNVLVAFQLLEEGDTPAVGSKLIPYHIIFDVKFNLTRKARLVAGGHRNKAPKPHETYSSVASRDSVRICLMLAALNGLDSLMADIGNAYLNAPCNERIHVKCGPELFGPDNEGKFAVIVRALYGLKTSGHSWRTHFSVCIREELGYEPTVADPDVYRKPEVKPDGTKYYSYFIVYVDDILCVHHNPKPIMDKLNTLFRLKDGVEQPSLYLGTDLRLREYTNDDGTVSKCWAMGSQSYLKEALKVAEMQMSKHNLSHSSTRSSGRQTPFKTQDYRPELDSSNFCDPTLANVYQNLIGILRWICELGRIDILHEVSLLSQYLAQPRMGHLTQCLNIFYYLKYHDRSWMMLDPTSYDIEWTPRSGEVSPQERAKAMKKIYTEAQDVLPHNMPEPRGQSVDINVFVDSDHAGNRVTRRSHTGILIYCNMAPVLWYSKRQNTVETSTFGSEFVALKIATELIEGLRYKLRMFGVPLSGPARVFCDNESVVKSSTFPESALKKKHCSVAYHKVREAVAADKLLIYYESTDTNIADLFTKVLPIQKRLPLIQSVLS